LKADRNSKFNSGYLLAASQLFFAIRVSFIQSQVGITIRWQ